MFSKPIFLYKITNQVNGKCYIGQTNNLKDRFRHHRMGKTSRILGCAINKYGIIHFKFEILDCVIFREVANELEQFYIKQVNSVVPNGYNLDSGGHENNKHSTETKEKIRNSLRGKYVGRKSSMFGVHKFGKDSPHYGKPHSEEAKKKISMSNAGQIPWNKGIPQSQETIDKIKKTKELKRAISLVGFIKDQGIESQSQGD